MILQADVAVAFEVFQGLLELVLAAVGILAGLGPVVQIGFDDLLAVQRDGDLCTLAVITI